MNNDIEMLKTLIDVLYEKKNSIEINDGLDRAINYLKKCIEMVT